MTDPRTPEQRAEDARNRAWVARVAHLERLAAWSPDQRDAYRAGRAAGLAGWSVRGTKGTEHHEFASDLATRRGVDDIWRIGYREGADLRAKEATT